MHSKYTSEAVLCVPYSFRDSQPAASAVLAVLVRFAESRMPWILEGRRLLDLAVSRALEMAAGVAEWHYRKAWQLCWPLCCYSQRHRPVLAGAVPGGAQESR